MIYLNDCCVVIPDSADYNEKEVRKMLENLRKENPDHEKLKIRSDRSYVCEWATHALLYIIGIEPERTKDSDMQFELKKWVMLLYDIFGTIARGILWIVE
jgi:hypothetical protein